MLPFFHIYGMVVIMNFGLMRGATMVTLPRFDLETVLRRPAGVADRARARRAAGGGGAREAPGGGPLRPVGREVAVLAARRRSGAELTEAVETRLSVRVRQGYGMTEASPVTHYTVPGARARRARSGLLVPSTEVSHGRSRERAPTSASGERGEVWVRGPQVMKGYLNNPEATARTIDADGWLHTGDIGVVDEDGYLEIVDRLKELIKVKGFQVAPAELEALLLEAPARSPTRP